MKPRTTSGMTLVEILVAISILGLLSAGVSTFYLESLRTAYVTQQQMGLITDMRNFTNEMFFNSSRAHEVILYDSPDAADRADATNRRQVTIDDDTDELICPTGNFVVFVYYELPKPSDQGRYRINRLIGYALERTDDDPGVLSRLTIELETPSTDSVEEILTANWDAAERRVYSRLVTPLALADEADDDTSPRLFYKRSEQSLAICGQLLKSARNLDSQDLRTLTRTMYFTVTTRS